MPRKKSKTRMYFHEGTEQAIIDYNAADTPRERNKIYSEHLRQPFEKLVENIIHTFKFYYFDIPLDDVKHEVISFMITRLGKYKQGKGKAFSYFSVVVKNWLICHNNANYKKMKSHKDVLGLGHDDVKSVVYVDEQAKKSEHELLFKEIISYWNHNIPKTFKKERDVNIAYSVLDLMSKVDSVEIFNKKALYILLREISGAKTQRITKVLNRMKGHFPKIMKQWNEKGGITPTGKPIAKPPVFDI